jgi:DNA-binding transcriptional ArsR family regulator
MRENRAESGYKWIIVERSGFIHLQGGGMAKVKDNHLEALRRKVDSGEISPQEALVIAIGHSLRLKVLTIMSDRPASPSQLADEGLDTLSNVAYHARVLYALRQVEIVGEHQRRGAIERVYRAVNPQIFVNPDWEAFDPKVRQALSFCGIEAIYKDLNSALGAGTFDASTKRHLSRMPADLDEQGWLEANAVQNEALDRLLEIREEANLRIAEGAKPMPVTAVMTCFQMPDPPQNRPE